MVFNATRLRAVCWNVHALAKCLNNSTCGGVLWLAELSVIHLASCSNTIIEPTSHIRLINRNALYAQH